MSDIKSIVNNFGGIILMFIIISVYLYLYIYVGLPHDLNIEYKSYILDVVRTSGKLDNLDPKLTKNNYYIDIARNIRENDSKYRKQFAYRYFTYTKKKVRMYVASNDKVDVRLNKGLVLTRYPGDSPKDSYVEVTLNRGSNLIECILAGNDPERLLMFAMYEDDGSDKLLLNTSAGEWRGKLFRFL